MGNGSFSIWKIKNFFSNISAKFPGHPCLLETYSEQRQTPMMKRFSKNNSLARFRASTIKIFPLKVSYIFSKKNPLWKYFWYDFKRKLFLYFPKWNPSLSCFSPQHFTYFFLKNLLWKCFLYFLKKSLLIFPSFNLFYLWKLDSNFFSLTRKYVKYLWSVYLLAATYFVENLH